MAGGGKGMSKSKGNSNLVGARPSSINNPLNEKKSVEGSQPPGGSRLSRPRKKDR